MSLSMLATPSPSPEKKKDLTLMPTEDGGIDYEEFMKGIIANDMSIMPNGIEEDDLPDEESDAIQSMEDVIKEEGVNVTPEEAEEIIDLAMPLHVKGGDKCFWVVETLLGKLLPHKPDDFIDHIATKICGDKTTSTSSTTSTITTSSNCGGDSGGDTRIVQGVDTGGRTRDSIDPCSDTTVEIAAPPENWGH